MSTLFWNIESAVNFKPLTIMYVKVYISRMEMSQRIYFWHQNLLKITIFEKMAKDTFWVNFFFQTAYKTQFWVKNAKIAWIIFRQMSRRDFLIFWLRPYFWKFWPKMSKKVMFWQKLTFLTLLYRLLDFFFWLKKCFFPFFQKKKEKKTHNFQHILIQKLFLWLIFIL